MTILTFFFILIPVLAIILLSVTFILAPHEPYKEKKTPFECGYHSFLQTRTQFAISFFIPGLLFLLFDLEIVLIYPFTTSSLFNGIYGLVSIIVFIFVLTLGFVFEIGKNALKIATKETEHVLMSKIMFTSNLKYSIISTFIVAICFGLILKTLSITLSLNLCFFIGFISIILSYLIKIGLLDKDFVTLHLITMLIMFSIIWAIKCYFEFYYYDNDWIIFIKNNGLFSSAMLSAVSVAYEELFFSFKVFLGKAPVHMLGDNIINPNLHSEKAFAKNHILTMDNNNSGSGSSSAQTGNNQMSNYDANVTAMENGYDTAIRKLDGIKKAYNDFCACYGPHMGEDNPNFFEFKDLSLRMARDWARLEKAQVTAEEKFHSTNDNKHLENAFNKADNLAKKIMDHSIYTRGIIRPNTPTIQHEMNIQKTKMQEANNIYQVSKDNFLNRLDIVREQEQTRNPRNNS